MSRLYCRSCSLQRRPLGPGRDKDSETERGGLTLGLSLGPQRRSIVMILTPVVFVTELSVVQHAVTATQSSRGQTLRHRAGRAEIGSVPRVAATFVCIDFDACESLAEFVGCKHCSEQHSVLTGIDAPIPGEAF